MNLDESQKQSSMAHMTPDPAVFLIFRQEPCPIGVYPPRVFTKSMIESACLQCHSRFSRNVTAQHTAFFPECSMSFSVSFTQDTDESLAIDFFRFVEFRLRGN